MFAQCLFSFLSNENKLFVLPVSDDLMAAASGDGKTPTAVDDAAGVDDELFAPLPAATAAAAAATTAAAEAVGVCCCC